MDVLYAINAKKEELAATKSPRLTAEPLSVTSSIISIAKNILNCNKKTEPVQGISQVQYEGNINTNSSFGANVSQKSRVVKSERGDGSSNRSLLANAFETISQNCKEYKQVQEYKAEIAVLNKLEAELHDLNQQIRDIMFSKGTRDNQKLKELEDRADRIAKGIAREDKKLLNMEASAPLRRVIEQERKKATQ
jgi:hypothetical protein